MNDNDHTFCRLYYGSSCDAAQLSQRAFRVDAETKIGFRRYFTIGGPHGYQWEGGAHCAFSAKATAVHRYMQQRVDNRHAVPASWKALLEEVPRG